ncbi:MAG TPA: sulfite exporter TauE/SafE family protein [Casimicrobiaceae bacterium]|nr:sulfite exporter TauE/SafE family protein [Casimicrobiaceae bacterium]
MNLALVPVFLALGAFVGFLAGLLGIGGGFTIVPVLVEVFARQGVDSSHLMPLAIGTSAATICFTAFASARAHHKRGAVAWPVVWAMAPGLVIGSLVGAQVASALPMRVMAACFGSFTWLTAAQMLRNAQPHPTRELPGQIAMFAMGSLIGLVAGMVGTGGAFLAVPFMTRCNVRVHTAVATSAAIGWPVAVAATIGYVIAGWRHEGLPAHSIGYVNLPALLCIAAATMMLAPVGAKVAHAWPVARLKRAFALMLFVLGAWMWVKALA